MAKKLIVKLFSQDSKTKGKLMTLPVVGDVQFNEEDNSIEIEDSQVDELLKLDFGIILLNEDQQFEKELKDQQSDADRERLREEKNKTLLMLKELDPDELEKLAVDYPKEETQKLKTKSSLINYLCNQMLKYK